MTVIAGPWAHRRVQGREKMRSRVVKETIHTIPSSFRLPFKSGVIDDTLFEKWVEFLRLSGDKKHWLWTLKAANIRYKIRFWEPRDEPRKVYGYLDAFHNDSGVKRVYVRTSSAENYLEHQVKEAVNSNVGKLLKGSISPEFEEEMIYEVENQLGYLNLSTPAHGFKYGEHHLVHKFRWWRLTHRSELTRQWVQG